MGANFYWKKEQKSPCECCGRPYVQEVIHIGKSSLGWCFSLHVTEDIQSLDDWKKVWETQAGFIENEYGDRVSVEDLLDRITNRSGRNRFDEPLEDCYIEFYLSGSLERYSWEDFHRKNHSEPGPNGLLRHKIQEPGHCVGHGEGTWDLIAGEFS